ncbi:MAG: helix-turn-helix domain-containing protein [Akkermansia sp.]
MKTQEENSPNRIFCSRFSMAIKQSNLTQKELAKTLNITEQTICRYKRGDRSPDIFELYRLAKFFGVTTDWLLGGELSGNESLWQKRALSAETRLAKINNLISLLEEIRKKMSDEISSG